MKFFRRNDRVLDLGERYRKQQKRAEEMKEDDESSSESNAGRLGFFGAIANTVSQSSDGYLGLAPKGVPSVDEDINTEGNVSSGVEDKRRKLAKRLMEMTNKIEELSNQIYHLQQRIEVLEKKSGVGGY